MFRCSRCTIEFIDGVQCSACQNRFDFPCAGITEGGFRKLGDRKNTWKCSSCKSGATTKSPAPSDMESIALELKWLSLQMSSLPNLTSSLKAIQDDMAAIKSSVDFVHSSMEALNTKVTEINQEVQGLLKTKEELHDLQQRFERMEVHVRDFEQRSRMNNIELKGVPFTQSENLFETVRKLGEFIGTPLPRDQINYIARIPMRNDKTNKNIIISVHNRYLKEDFVAAAKKRSVVAADLNLKGDSRIYVNDHLTLENKMLLNKTKKLVKERGFDYIWVKGCEIFVRKNPSSHVFVIKSESDLKNITQ